MRARGELGEVLRDAGEKEAAIQNFREMPVLNPGDNQGIRYILAAKLLEMGKMDELKSLMEQCADEYSPEIRYTRALIAYFEEAENVACTEGGHPESTWRKYGKSCRQACHRPRSPASWEFPGARSARQRKT